MAGGSLRLAPDRLETPRLALRELEPANHPSRRVADRLGMRPGRRVLFNDREHIVYRVEAARCP